MNSIVIVEDEIPARNRLSKLVKGLSVENQIVAELDSIEDAVQWFSSNQMPDISFFDIQLADGLSFRIFEKTKITCPIIFTTAFDEYAIRAFRVNSIDYLLKPVDESDLVRAWKKYKTLKDVEHPEYQMILKELGKMKFASIYKSRFLIKVGNQYKYVAIQEVRYFYSHDSRTYLVDLSGKSYILNEGLDDLNETLAPKQFFRINRKYILSERCISKISTYFNGRLVLEVDPSSEGPVIVARDRVNDFKKWLDA